MSCFAFISIAVDVLKFAVYPADAKHQRLNEALHAVQYGLLTLRQAQSIYNIPKSTLHRKLYSLGIRQKAR